MIEDQHQSIEMPREEHYTLHLCFAVGKKETPLRIRRKMYEINLKIYLLPTTPNNKNITG
jgi:hypothetical protein